MAEPFPSGEGSFCVGHDVHPASAPNYNPPMLAASLPPLLKSFMNWADSNPAMGAVAVIMLIVVLLWLVRKSIKFFMVVGLLLVGAVLVSYFFNGKEKTNNLVREKAKQAMEEGRDLINKANDSLNSEEEGGEGDTQKNQ